jgi:pyruvate dehydrogenase E2 component (dihydrolipoamide acetyltransferase)
MPQLGLTMTHGTVVRWLKAEGDLVKQGEPVLEIETDKVTAEIEAPADGVLGPILAEEGAAVPIGGLLSHVLGVGEVSPPTAAMVGAQPGAPPTSAPRTGYPLTTQAEKTEPPPAPEAAEQIIASPRARRLAYELGIDLSQVEASGPGGRVVEADVRWHAEQVKAAPARVSPVARHLAEELGVDLTRVRGSGPGGRIVKEDVERAAASTPAPSSFPGSTEPRPERDEGLAKVPPATLPYLPGAPAEREIEPLEGGRRVVAERMTHSFSTAPHFYLSAEVEATALTRMREGLLPKVEAASGARLAITDILVKVCAEALSEYPQVNVAWAEDAQGGGVLRHSEVNIGVAVALDAGLVVPVIRRADQLTLAEIAGRRSDMADRARSGKLTLQDVEGGTFTLSNLGMFRVDQFQAILNPPQSAILAVGRIRERPVALDGAVVVRPTMILTLSVDHRLLDGAQAARFLERVVQLIEEPYLLQS